jgi:tetratricopeptide (TPR) repeat protein
LKQAIIRTTLTVALLGVMGGPGLGAPDTEVDRAGALVEQGLTHARKGEFRAAAELFEQAVKLNPDPTILHSLARAREEMGSHALAFETFRQALEMSPQYIYAEDARERMAFLERLLASTHARLRITSTPGGADVTIRGSGGSLGQRLITPFSHWAPAGDLEISAQKDGFQDASRSITLGPGQEERIDLVLRPVIRKGFLAVVSSVSGAEIYIDGELRGVAPMEPMLIEAGPHAIQVEAEGYEPIVRDILVEPDKETRVMTRFGADNPAAAGGGAKERPVDPLAPILIGAGATAVVGALIMHLSAFDAAADANALYDDVETFNDNDEHLASVRAFDEAKALDDEAKRSQVIAFVGYGVAAGLVGFGTWMIVGGGEPPPASGEASKDLGWTPLVLPSPGGLFAGAELRF